MSSYHIGSVNAQNAQIGDNNTQNNTQVTIDGELARLGAAIDRHAHLLSDVAAARRALAILRVACAAQPMDARRVRQAAGELATTATAAPAVNAEIARLLGRISQ